MPGGLGSSRSRSANHFGNTSGVFTQTVQKAATTTMVATSGSPSSHGSPVTFTVTVSSSAGTPTGNVEFSDSATLLGTMALSGGTAQLTTSALAVGTHTIHAAYNGNGNYAVSSGQVKQQVLHETNANCSKGEFCSRTSLLSWRDRCGAQSLTNHSLVVSAVIAVRKSLHRLFDCSY
jgi:hypothetical protein